MVIMTIWTPCPPGIGLAMTSKAEQGQSRETAGFGFRMDGALWMSTSDYDE